MQGFAHILLLSGPSGSGKSTFARLLQEGHLPDDIRRRLPSDVGTWPVIDVTNRLRREIEANGEAAATARMGAPSRFVLHYDIATVYRYGLAGYGSDPALRLLPLAREIQVVLVCPDARRLLRQYSGRDAVRQARKPAVSRAWNAVVLGPMRRLRGRSPERTLYGNPEGLARCYAAWESYLADTLFTSPRWGEVGSDCKSLPGEGATRPDPWPHGVIRVAPSEDNAGDPAFRLVPAPGGGSRD